MQHAYTAGSDNVENHSAHIASPHGLQEADRINTGVR